MAWASTRPGRTEDRTNVQTETEKRRANHPTQARRIAKAEGEKSLGRTRATQKMLKMKGDPEMSMKTKDRTTICPTQKTTIVPGCTSSHTKIQIFCRNQRLFCYSSSLGKRTS